MEKIKDYKYKIKGIEAECEIRGDTKGHFSQTCLLSKNGEKIGKMDMDLNVKIKIEKPEKTQEGEGTFISRLKKEFKGG